MLVTIFPWNSLDGEGSPFVQVFALIGIPAAASIMNLVVITAELSAVNAQMFTNSRTFYNMALQGNAPASLGTVNQKNVPSRAILLVFVLMAAGVVLNFLMPDQVLVFVAAVLICIAIRPDMRVSLLVSAAWVLVVYIAYRFYARTHARRSPAVESGAQSERPL